MTKILLADDSVTIQKVVELTFSDEASEVTAVSDGTAALEKAQLQRPDIILSDVIMPGMNGYELCQSVKSDPNLKSIPFLFLKGTFESFDEDKARQCGADGFIVKPFESQDLINKVTELVNRIAAPEAPVIPEPAAVEDVPEPSPPSAPAPTPVQPPAPPPEPPTAVETPAAAAPPVEESFDLNEEDMVEDIASPAPSEAVEEPAASPEAEQEEDLWSEVSLRDSEAPLIEDKVLEDESFWGATEESAGMESPEDAPAGEDLLAEVDETDVFDLGAEEMEQPVATEPPPVPDLSDPFFTPPAEEPAAEAAPVETFALEETADPSGPTFETPVAEPVPETAPVETFAAEETADLSGPTFETPVAEPVPETAPEPAPLAEPVAAAPAAPAESINTEALEKAIAAKIEDAVLKVLGPAVEETARKIVEEVAWEVIPDLAEAMIKSEIERIKAENS